MPRTPTSDDAPAPESKSTEKTPEPETPKPRYFTVQVNVDAFSDDQNITVEGVEIASKEQVILPTTLDIDGRKLTVLGAKVGGVSESGDRPKTETGFGREGDPEEEEDKK
jgi:hypothetical protein